MTQASPLKYDCTKTAICIYLFQKHLPTINVLLYMMTIWLAVVREARGHAIIAPLSDYLQLSPFIKTHFRFSICLVTDLQFVLGSCFIWICGIFKRGLLIISIFNVLSVAFVGECNALWCGSEDRVAGYSDPCRQVVVLSYYNPGGT